MSGNEPVRTMTTLMSIRKDLRSHDRNPSVQPNQGPISQLTPIERSAVPALLVAIKQATVRPIPKNHCHNNILKTITVLQLTTIPRMTLDHCAVCLVLATRPNKLHQANNTNRPIMVLRDIQATKFHIHSR